MLSSNDFNSSLAFSLDQFKKHDLVKADSIDLMNRVDSKFLFRLSELPKILEECVSSYSALQMLKTCFLLIKILILIFLIIICTCPIIIKS